MVTLFGASARIGCRTSNLGNKRNVLGSDEISVEPIGAFCEAVESEGFMRMRLKKMARMFLVPL